MVIYQFKRVTPKVTNKLNQELYLFHRAGLAKKLVIREATQPNDFATIERLVHNIHSRESILNDLNCYLKSRKDLNGVDIQVYVADVLGRIVGFAIIRQEEVGF